jgi:hypothetical protein
MLVRPTPRTRTLRVQLGLSKTLPCQTASHAVPTLSELRQQFKLPFPQTLCSETPARAMTVSLIRQTRRRPYSQFPLRISTTRVNWFHSALCSQITCSQTRRRTSHKQASTKFLSWKRVSPSIWLSPAARCHSSQFWATTIPASKPMISALWMQALLLNKIADRPLLNCRQSAANTQMARLIVSILVDGPRGLPASAHNTKMAIMISPTLVV